MYEIGLIDKAGNYTFLSKEEVEIVGGTTQFLLENSAEDLEPPSIKNIEFNQKTFDFSKENVNDLFIKIQIEEEFINYQEDSFNQYIGNWNTSSVTDIGYIFQLAISFTQDL